MSLLALSVLLCLVSAVCYAAAAIVQERVAATAGGGIRGTLRSGAWWGAVALTGLGAGLHVLALAWGPLSLVQPMGALTIVFALPMAAVFAHRPVGAAGYRGALLATGGLAGLLALTGPPGTESLPAAERPLLAAGMGAAVALTALVARRVRRPVVRGVLLATAAGVAFGMGSVFTKAAAEDVTGHRTGALLPTLVITAVLASAGMLLSQASYRGAGLAAPLATVTVANPVVAAAVGVCCLGEAFRYGLTGGVLAGLAGAAAAAGVVILTFRGAAGASEGSGVAEESGTAEAPPARLVGPRREGQVQGEGRVPGAASPLDGPGAYGPSTPLAGPPPGPPARRPVTRSGRRCLVSSPARQRSRTG
ncbi:MULTISPECIES: DMT family transporter [Streptomyces]|uniref:DMT family transporter n=1 Tax=Streptomyces TaxID=1883 RepID=UPI00163C61DD|nr:MULTISPECIES: DMT family transporter [Streptomyces]MBC2876883.1 DMT family transporter [Streptomyces sp. TYQ1024]UBI35913.1 DMT family transporter [Streptomyces mobaraensis]UKW28507.1 DMT family transporter [Streptomyces sp. TYQ1024]